MNDRIKLAKAMGLITDIEMPSAKGKAPFRIVYPNGCGQICDNPLDYLPDPETDANDDYAVLECMRNGDKEQYSDFKDALYHEEKGHGTHNVWNYKLGKFARAALKVIE